MGEPAEKVYLRDLPLEQAWAQFTSALESLGRFAALPGELIALDQALGRVTAEPVWAKISSPHYHAAAMDGYALRAAETQGANDRSPITLQVGKQASYLDTGDPLPEWADAVLPIEQAEPEGETRLGRALQAITLRAAVAPWSNVRPIGEDMVVSELVLPAGHVLRPIDLGAAAGSGHAQLRVRRKPRVAIIPTGSELVPPSENPARGQIIEYNSLVLAGQVESWGGDARRWPIVPDELSQIIAATREAAAWADLVLLNAGSSAGLEDFTAAAVAALGEVLVHGVAVRPGHPVILGLIRDVGVSLPVIGVPGFPVSAALTGEIFVQPLIRHWLGLPKSVGQSLEATLTRKVHSSLGDDEFLRVSVARVGDRIVAAPLARAAGVIISLVRADGVVQIPAGTQGYPAGAKVRVRLYREPEEIDRTILIQGSHDLTIDLLAQHLAVRGTRLSSANVGSLGGLLALRRGEAHLAGCHLFDPETGDYNLPYVRKQLTGAPVMVVGLVGRQQGLIVASGNPKQISGLRDLGRPDVAFVNRQRGSGTRILLDYQLEQMGIEAAAVRGYQREEYTHLAVAASVAAGSADCGMGIQAAASALGLDLVPLFRERYDLVIPEEHYITPLLAPLLEALHDEEFRTEVTKLPGYDLQRMGEQIARLA